MNNFLAFQVHGNADGQGISDLLESILIFLNGLLGKSAAEIFSSLMPGIAILDNIHPVLVHFPIAFLSGFVILDWFASLTKKTHWREFAGGLLYLGTIMAVFTVIAGFAAANSVAHGEDVHAIMERHEGFGITVLCLAVTLSGWRWKSGHQMRGEFNILYLILSALLGLFLMLGADLGGLMVYKYGVAVEVVPVSVQNSHKNHTH
jgi:uncharacterized membrane protein